MRVLVTRPESDARRTAERLLALGHEPLVAPVLRIEPAGEPPDGDFDALLLTSANAVSALEELGPHAKGRPVFAVGDRTASRARAEGFEVRSAAGGAGALAALVQASLPRGAALLHVAGADRKPEPKASLARAGYRITVWTAYAATPVERLPSDLEAALAGRALEAALHYSRRSAATLLRVAGEAGLAQALLDLGHVCLSADAAAPLREAGACHVVVAVRPDEASLLAALVPTSPARDRSPEVARGW